MEDSIIIDKIIRKSKKIVNPATPLQKIISLIAKSVTIVSEREIVLISNYYGLVTKASTLEEIGKSRVPPLTRERVRQLIANSLDKIFKDDNIFGVTLEKVNVILANKKFISFKDIVKNEDFKDFSTNQKGLITLLNDCGVKQISYRKNMYFYLPKENRKSIIKDIQAINKEIRKSNTLENILKKSKTVTYVPDDIKAKLQEYAIKSKNNLNPTYEEIIEEFIKESPYKSEGYVFTKTKSWRARKGKAKWKQIGIYINKDVFDKIKSQIDKIKSEFNIKVSLMGFICQAFIWKFEK